MKSPSLGELEEQIMNIIWNEKECSIRDVLIILQKNRSIAYTTVATILQRLYDKTLVDRKEDKEKLGNIYFAKVTKESYIKNISRSFLDKLTHSFGDVAIASFAESIEELPLDKKVKLYKLLDNYEKNK